MESKINDNLSDSSEIAPLIPDSKELQNFIDINSKNLETFKEYTDSVCSNFSLKGSPWNHLTNLSAQCSALKEEEFTQNVNLFTIQSKINSTKKGISQFSDEIIECKQEIEKIIAEIMEVSLEAESFRNKQKSKHAAYMQALQFYKHHLDLYVNIEEDQSATRKIKVCFFTKKLSDDYAMLLLRNDVRKTWEFQDVNPKLPDCQFFALKTRLKETNNISKFIVTIQKIFTIMRNN